MIQWIRDIATFLKELFFPRQIETEMVDYTVNPDDLRERELTELLELLKELGF